MEDLKNIINTMVNFLSKNIVIFSTVAMALIINFTHMFVRLIQKRVSLPILTILILLIKF